MTVLAIALLLAAPAKDSPVRDQGAVKGHVWTTAAGLESARICLRGVMALANDATAWDGQHARALVRAAKSTLVLARTHGHHLKMFSAKGSDQDRPRLDSDLGGALLLITRLEKKIGKGVSPGLRDDLKAAWDKLEDARKDLDKLAGDFDTTAKLPEP